MQSIVAGHRVVFAFVLGVITAGALGCGGSGAYNNPVAPISVYFNVPSITVSQSGQQVVVPIMIVSPSETATLSIIGLPGGVSQSYHPSDTNPSGDLIFMAGPITPTGSYKLTITANSAGQTAMTTVTLIVVTASKS